MLSDPLTNFEMLRYHQNKSRFNVLYSRNLRFTREKGCDIYNKS